MTLLFVSIYYKYISIFSFSVCIKFLTKFDKSLTEEERKDQDQMTVKLKKACGKAKNKDNRFVSKYSNNDNEICF